LQHTYADHAPAVGLAGDRYGVLISFRALCAKKGGSAMKIKIWCLAATLIMLYVSGWNGLVQAGEVYVNFPDADSTFNVIRYPNNLFRVQGNGRVGIGADAPERFLHVRGDDFISKIGRASCRERV
jgi:hypothetical protein